jgi:hypothetical protein
MGKCHIGGCFSIGNDVGAAAMLELQRPVMMMVVAEALLVTPLSLQICRQMIVEL